MKFYLSVDIEGVAGICDWQETVMEGKNYPIFREQMLNETAACVKILLEEGHEVYVRDAHDSACNLNPAELPPGINIIRGWENHPCDMLSGLDESFDGCIFIGYHSPSRSDGNPLSHTLSTNLNHIKINNQIVNEFTLNAYYSQSCGVPVILVSGDENLTKQIAHQNSYIETVSTKKGHHGAVISKHPADVLKDIESTTKLALKKLSSQNKSKFFLVVPKQFETEIYFRNHINAHFASFYPGASRLSPDKVLFQTNSIIELLTFIMFVTK